MLVKAFFRWAETARAGDRAKAANAFGRAYLTSAMTEDERQAALMAMTYLLDDPSPLVRQGLAEALGHSADAPRSLILALAEDQPEIASRVILFSPVLSEADLVELCGRGGSYTRAFVAARPHLAATVAAALAEIGDGCDVLVLLDNATAQLSAFSLIRIAERFGDREAVRGALLARNDLPAQARNLLVRQVAEAFSEAALLRLSLGEVKSRALCRNVQASAAAAIAGEVDPAEMPDLVEDMRRAGQLTPAFLMQVLCQGHADFFAVAIEMLSGLDERRVRSILAGGRLHAVKALVQAAGLDHTIAPLFAEAVLLWRETIRTSTEAQRAMICEGLLKRGKALTQGPEAAALLTLVHQLWREEERRMTRQQARLFALEAAA